MIRLILILIFLLFFAIYSIVALPIVYIVNKINDKTGQKHSQRVTRHAFKIILFLAGTKIDIKGLENIPKDRSVLFISNHRSDFDVVIIYALLPVLTGFVSKIEVKKVPILRRWMQFNKCVFLDRKNPREGLKAILAAVENVNNGTSMYIAPEGTRNHEKEMLPFKPGSLKIAEKSGCPIIPIALTNTDAIFENQKPRVKKARVQITFGKPIEVGSLDAEGKKTLLEDTQNTVKKMLEDNLKS
jgi:1-acyl-sn-glycerol-3-phosphate acyltransferase